MPPVFLLPAPGQGGYGVQSVRRRCLQGASVVVSDTGKTIRLVRHLRAAGRFAAGWQSSYLPAADRFQ